MGYNSGQNFRLGESDRICYHRPHTEAEQIELRRIYRIFSADIHQERIQPVIALRKLFRLGPTNFEHFIPCITWSEGKGMWRSSGYEKQTLV